MQHILNEALQNQISKFRFVAVILKSNNYEQSYQHIYVLGCNSVKEHDIFRGGSARKSSAQQFHLSPANGKIRQRSLARTFDESERRS